MDTLARIVDKKFADVATFATDYAFKCPARLRTPHGSRAFKALSPAEREAAIRANLLAEVEREHAATAARAKASAPAQPVPAPEPAKPKATARHVVACAGNCGKLIPAQPGRSTLATCSPSKAEEPKPRSAAAELVPGRKRPKVRRRFRCGSAS